MWLVLLAPLVTKSLTQNIHGIGDRANHVVLDIFEDILSSSVHGSAAERRPRIEHAQIMTLDDLKRAGRLQGLSLFSYQ